MYFAVAFILISFGINYSECTNGYQVYKSLNPIMMKGSVSKDSVSQGSFKSEFGVCGSLGQKGFHGTRIHSGVEASHSSLF